MRLKIDKETNSLYLRLNEAEIVESEEVQPGMILDFDEKGQVVGAEILALSTWIEPEKLHIFQLGTT
jgi:uncharacterized protein YuzE